ncbi:MAG: hypothetical protein OXI81_17745 [Paracoccaceae bacterium]|nr:hypothetical protein [Paracoccaceae bacterium]MDE2911933.1 hypothetical protein [Paracoccaceae bacterium]
MILITGFMDKAAMRRLMEVPTDYGPDPADRKGEMTVIVSNCDGGNAVMPVITMDLATNRDLFTAAAADWPPRPLPSLPVSDGPWRQATRQNRHR